MQELIAAKSCGFTEVLEYGHVSQHTEGEETLLRVCVPPHPQLTGYQCMQDMFTTCIAPTCAATTPDIRALD